MSKITKCIDSGTEFCPCKLAESNECVLCTQMQGNLFCDCFNWNGVCIYQEFVNNGLKAKAGRKSYKCKVLNYKLIKEDLLFLKLEVSHKICIDLVQPGSYIFIEPDDDKYYNTPISIMESIPEENAITMVVDIKGIKTKWILENVKKEEFIKIKAPFWNGVFGLDNLNNQKNSKSLILAKSVGVAPMIPVIRKLNQLGNDITALIDCDDELYDFISTYLVKYKVKVNRVKLLENGELSDIAKSNIEIEITNETKFIYSAGVDIMIYKVIEHLDKLDRKDILLGCCNNFTMCCGEGICGACTIRFKGGNTRRFCKEQVDPRSIFEGRRYI